MEIHELATEYMVSALPPDTQVGRSFAVWIQRYEGDLWEVRRAQNGFREWLDSTGEWTFGREGEAQEDWNARTKFDLPTARRLAHEAAPRVVVNGLTVDHWLERLAARKADR